MPKIDKRDQLERRIAAIDRWEDFKAGVGVALVLFGLAFSLAMPFLLAWLVLR